MMAYKGRNIMVNTKDPGIAATGDKQRLVCAALVPTSNSIFGPEANKKLSSSIS